MFVGFVKGHMISTLPLKDTLRRNMVGCTNVIEKETKVAFRVPTILSRTQKKFKLERIENKN